MHSRSRLTVFVLLLFVLPALSLFPDEQSVMEITARIMEEQGVRRPGDIDPDLVSPADMEELGFQIMGAIVDDPDWHKWLNDIMGGRGSPRNMAVHIRFARHYLEMDGTIPQWNNTIMAPGITTDRWSPWFSPDRHILHRPIHVRVYHLLIFVAVLALVFWGVFRRKK
tara:strand:+ start:966 stop:1469 length:504 start_codon:yes stop_codon:yes gene_type:complete